MTFTPVIVESWQQRVLFGVGTAREDIAAEVARLGARRVLLIAAKAELELAERICRDVPIAATFSDISPHVPEDVVIGVREAVRQHRADLLLSVGGGSTTGAAKVAALSSGVAVLAVPTTYAGSEATPVWGMTEAGRKRTGVDPRVLPIVVIYDATLMLSLPVSLSVTSGLNALAHCVDSWWAPRHNPVSSALAGEALAALASALPRIVADGQDVQARHDMLFGAYLAAGAFAGAGSGLHHKICHVLGGKYNLAHAPMHAVVLPHTTGVNLRAAPEAERRLAAALDVGSDPFGALNRLYAVLDAPRSLGELGLREADLDRATELVLEQVPPSNPRPITAPIIRELLGRAQAGESPVLLPAPASTD